MDNEQDIEEEIIQLLAESHHPVTRLSFLGSGNEGYVFATDDLLLKYFPDKKDVPEPSLTFMKEHILNNPNVERLRPLSEIIETETGLLFISPNEHCTPYTEGDIDGTLEILVDAYRNRYVHLNFKPENLMYSADGILKLIDLGRDIVPFEISYFRNMTERAFLTASSPHAPNLKELMGALLTADRQLDEKQLRDYTAKLKHLIESYGC